MPQTLVASCFNYVFQQRGTYIALLMWIFLSAAGWYLTHGTKSPPWSASALWLLC